LRRQTLHFYYRNCRRFNGFLKEINVRHIIGKQLPYRKPWFHARANGILFKKTNDPTTITIAKTKVSCSCASPDLMKGHLGAKDMF